MKAYSYIRFSTDIQTWGDSERRQEQLAKDYCARRGLTLADSSFADRGVSGWKGKNRQNGAFAQLMQVTKPGDCILIEDNDRFSREDPITALAALRDVVQRGVNVAFLKTGVEVNSQNFNDASVLFPNFFQAHLANQENVKKSYRLSEAWLAKRGKLSTEKATARCVGWVRLSEDRKRFVAIPERAKVVKQIFEWSRAGVGANTIARRLNQAEVPNWGPGKSKAECWHGSYIKRILENRAVIGEFVPGTYRTKDGKRQTFDPIVGYYPAVITKELFATVQQMRKTRPSFKGRSTFNVFSKLAFDQDGKPMAYVNKSPKGERNWHYLVSSAAVRGLAEYHAWDYDDFKASFLAVCEKAALSKPPKAEDDAGELNVKRMELADLEKQIERLVDFLSRGASVSVETKLRKLEDDRTAAQKAIADLESERIAAPKQVNQVDWEDNDALRENLRATVKRITVDPKRKAFTAEFFDGRFYKCEPKGDKIVISKNEVQQ